MGTLDGTAMAEDVMRPAVTRDRDQLIGQVCTKQKEQSPRLRKSGRGWSGPAGAAELDPTVMSRALGSGDGDATKAVGEAVGRPLGDSLNGELVELDAASHRLQIALHVAAGVTMQRVATPCRAANSLQKGSSGTPSQVGTVEDSGGAVVSSSRYSAEGVVRSADEGKPVGSPVGRDVAGEVVGITVGLELSGAAVGMSVGPVLGSWVGSTVGAVVGMVVGADGDGKTVGTPVGRDVAG